MCCICWSSHYHCIHFICGAHMHVHKWTLQMGRWTLMSLIWGDFPTSKTVKVSSALSELERCCTYLCTGRCAVWTLWKLCVIISYTVGGIILSQFQKGKKLFQSLSGTRYAAVCVYMFVFVFVCVVFVCVFVCVNRCVFVCVCLVCLCVFVFVSVCSCVLVCVCLCVHVFVFVCVFVWFCVYTW